jgi:very-short-patch-repair endonuclease
MGISQIEEVVARQVVAAAMPDPIREYKFHPTRRWRFDFAWPAYKIALEIEGGVWIRGRHTRGQGFTSDCQKYTEAALLGWMVLRVTPDMVNDGAALDYLKRALETRKDH